MIVLLNRNQFFVNSEIRFLIRFTNAVAVIQISEHFKNVPPANFTPVAGATVATSSTIELYMDAQFSN